jgi:hypothetical protein
MLQTHVTFVIEIQDGSMYSDNKCKAISLI